jgi:hypothetical protein
MTNNSPIIGFRYPRKEELKRRVEKEGKTISQVAIKKLDEYLSSEKA